MSTLAELLDRRPVFAAIVDAVLAEVAPLTDVVAVRGGLVKGRLNDYSDLDLAVTVEPDRADEVLVAVDRTIASFGPVLARYPASHRGLPWLYVYLVEVESELIKVDVSIEFGGHRSSATEQVLWQRPGTSPAPARPEPDTVPLDLAMERCAGWIWYVFCRIQAGELLEAERGLATLRAHVVVPLLRLRHDLPQEDFRRLETLLPPDLLKRLHDGYPAAVTEPALTTALAATTELVLDLATACGAPPDKVANVRRTAGYCFSQRSSQL